MVRLCVATRMRRIPHGRHFHAGMDVPEHPYTCLILQVWSLDVNPSCTRMVTGASDNQLRVWSLDGEGEGHGGETDPTAGGEASDRTSDDIIAVYMGSVSRLGNGEFQGLPQLLLHSSGGGLNIWISWASPGTKSLSPMIP